MFGSILGAIAGPLIGGLFGSSRSSKPQVTTNEVDYVKLRKNAERGGFNPLTALRHGGAAGHMVTTHPALSTPGPGAAIGQGLAEGISALASGGPWNVRSAAPTQSNEIAADQLTYQILEKQLRNFTTNLPQSKAGFGDVPIMVQTAPGTGTRATQALTSQLEMEPARATLYTGPPVPGGNQAQTPLPMQVNLTNPWPRWTGIRVSPSLPDASAWQERYGEPGEWIGGAATFAGDVAYSAYQAATWADKFISDQGKQPHTSRRW